MCLPDPRPVELAPGAGIDDSGVLVPDVCSDNVATRCGRGPRLVGIAFKRCYATCRCAPTVVNALALRHLAPPAYPIRCVPGPSWLSAVQGLLRSHYDAAMLVAPEKWRARKSREFLQAIDQSHCYDVDDFDIKGHVKHEVCLARPTKARLIQAHANPHTAYDCAPEYKSLHLALCAVSGADTVVGGMRVVVHLAMGLQPDAIAEVVHGWDGRGMLYESDGSNWDANIQLAHLRRKLELYEFLDPRLHQHARRWAGKFRGSVSGKYGRVLYRGEATVKSGAQDTSSGNSAMRAELFVAACHMAGLQWVEVLVMGDDLLACVPWGTDPELLAECERRVGVNAKAAGFEHPEQTTFLSATFPPMRGSRAFVPLPGRLFGKLFWTVAEVAPRTRAAYVQAVAGPYLPLFCNNVLVQTWLSRHVRLNPDLPVPSSFRMERPRLHGGHDIDWWRMWAIRYQRLLPGADDPVVHLVRGCDMSRSWILSDPHVEHIIRVDTADARDRRAVSAETEPLPG